MHKARNSLRNTSMRALRLQLSGRRGAPILGTAPALAAAAFVLATFASKCARIASSATNAGRDNSEQCAPGLPRRSVRDVNRSLAPLPEPAHPCASGRSNLLG